ncbi:hypothetical protein [Geminisphaera colitermitum]|uniref:hypothetical protein n=1 Tax=Geminisphaera colitermitum TaxID=1148786 RepID=UPI000F62AE9A|nr:hypothetical protein [Geminisphaera colitermitum]RRJ99987.1 hypothetical protein Ga0100230_018470 [Opitutaceae bacterium TAV3]
MLDHARLLAAETLASGKFSSPPSSGSFFLQTHLTLQSPAYAAALHPGESLLLALGTLWGEPVYGLWLGSAIFSLSIAWAIAGFASLRWCILGSIFGTLCYTFLCSWGQSFSGDINTAIGVALAWGAVRRYASTPTTRHTALLFIGLGFAFLCNPVAALLFAPIPLWIWFSTWKRQNFVKTHLATAVVLVAAAMTIQGVHNHATTGDMLSSAVSLYSKKYANHPYFIWQQPRLPSTFDFPHMEQYDVLVNEIMSRPPPKQGKAWLDRIQASVAFYGGIPLLVLIIGGAWTGLSKWGKLLLINALIICTGILIILPFNLSSISPLSTVLLLFGILMMRKIWTIRNRMHRDCWQLTWLLVIAFALVSFYRGPGIEIPMNIARHLEYKKSIIKHLLEHSQGKHLVMVKYDNGVPPSIEYVFNGANPTDQQIVWARWHDSANPTDLFDYFKGRNLWMLMVHSDTKPDLRPFAWEKQATQ